MARLLFEIHSCTWIPGPVAPLDLHLSYQKSQFSLLRWQQLVSASRSLKRAPVCFPWARPTWQTKHQWSARAWDNCTNFIKFSSVTRIRLSVSGLKSKSLRSSHLWQPQPFTFWPHTIAIGNALRWSLCGSCSDCLRARQIKQHKKNTTKTLQKNGRVKHIAFLSKRKRCKHTVSGQRRSKRRQLHDATSIRRPWLGTREDIDQTVQRNGVFQPLECKKTEKKLKAEFWGRFSSKKPIWLRCLRPSACQPFGVIAEGHATLPTQRPEEKNPKDPGRRVEPRWQKPLMNLRRPRFQLLKISQMWTMKIYETTPQTVLTAAELCSLLVLLVLFLSFLELVVNSLAANMFACWSSAQLAHSAAPCVPWAARGFQLRQLGPRRPPKSHHLEDNKPNLIGFTLCLDIEIRYRVYIYIYI